MDNLKVIGVYPATAINHVLNVYDCSNEKDKIKVLIQTYDANAIPVNQVPKRFASKQMIDIKAGELLSLGVIGIYYSILGHEHNRTFQVIVGVEDVIKKQIENIISDGAIWENEIKKKMPFQQTLIQGYFPKSEITTERVIASINKKISVRSRYPEHCGLLISFFGTIGKINFEEIVKVCRLGVYDNVFVVAYHMPQLDTVEVLMLEENMDIKKFANARRLMNLPRGDSGPWLVNEAPR